MGYISPKRELNVFSCSHCKALTQNRKEYHYLRDEDFATEDYGVEFSIDDEVTHFTIGQCIACKGYYIWKNDELIYPLESGIENPNEDMPERIKELYNEARRVYPLSKRASAALLRLALQHLCVELGEREKTLNENIKNLVLKGLPIEVQRSLDFLRVIGNESVHIGTLNIDEDEELVEVLFSLLNIIVEKMITEPKKIESFYNKIPISLKKSIAKRDKK